MVYVRLQHVVSECELTANGTHPFDSRTRSYSFSSTTSHGGSKRSVKSRETHNQLEKNRRAQLKSCFDSLKVRTSGWVDLGKPSSLPIMIGLSRYWAWAAMRAVHFPDSFK
jgi:hypothetical protein